MHGLPFPIMKYMSINYTNELLHFNCLLSCTTCTCSNDPNPSIHLHTIHQIQKIQCFILLWGNSVPTNPKSIPVSLIKKSQNTFDRISVHHRAQTCTMGNLEKPVSLIACFWIAGGNQSTQRKAPPNPTCSPLRHDAVRFTLVAKTVETFPAFRDRRTLLIYLFNHPKYDICKIIHSTTKYATGAAVE